MNLRSLINTLSFFFIMLSSSLHGIAHRTVCCSFPVQEEAEWNRYFDRGEEFSVLLPEAPSVEFKSRPDKEISARYQGRIYGAYDNGIVYVIISENNPKRAEKLDTFIKEFRETLPRHQSFGSSTSKFDREINLDSFHGKRYRLEFYDGTKGLVDFYITSKHVYIVEVAGGDESNPSIQRFLSSFSLDEKMLEKNDAIDGSQSSKQASPSPEPTRSPNQTTDRIFTAKEVDRHPMIVSRPEPYYTNEARQNHVTGTVVLKAVLTSSGKVTNIEIVKGLRHGLTERAAGIAKKLKFIPAVKDGKFVSQYIQIEYNFNLY